MTDASSRMVRSYPSAAWLQHLSSPPVLAEITTDHAALRKWQEVDLLLCVTKFKSSLHSAIHKRTWPQQTRKILILASGNTIRQVIHTFSCPNHGHSKHPMVCHHGMLLVFLSTLRCARQSLIFSSAQHLRASQKGLRHAPRRAKTTQTTQENLPSNRSPERRRYQPAMNVRELIER